MVVISDTSPLTALLQAWKEKLLGLVVLARQRRLIGEVAPVIRELQTKGGCWFGRELLVEICRTVGERWE